MDFFWRSISRRRRLSATLALVRDGAVGQDLAVESLKQRPEIADRPGARAQARETLGGRCQDRLGVRRAIERAKRSYISFGSRLAPSMWSLWTAGWVSGRPPKSTRIAAPRRRGLWARRDAEVLNRFTGLGEIV